jgi:hypothetical protein
MDLLRDTDANAKIVGKNIVSNLYPLLEKIQTRIDSNQDEKNQELSSEERHQLIVGFY